MAFAVGDLVCVHDADAIAYGWIGIVAQVAPRHGLYQVKQRGLYAVTAFGYAAHELREVLTSFEGPACVECGIHRLQRNTR